MDDIIDQNCNNIKNSVVEKIGDDNYNYKFSGVSYKNNIVIAGGNLHKYGNTLVVNSSVVKITKNKKIT